MNKNKVIRPEWCTVVDPSEYDIEKQFEQAVEDANEEQAQYYMMDIGKVWGLYLSWKEQKEKIESLKHALNDLLDGLDANNDERGGLSNEEWLKRIENAWKALK